MKKTKIRLEDASFRDPAGFIFYEGDKVLRQVNLVYKDDFDFLFDSGLYQTLVAKEILLPHRRIKNDSPKSSNTYLTLQVEKIPFVSYPYEWAFGQLKDAALLTLRVMKIAMKHGMILKDASAFNVQFYKGKPILIDILSFERYHEDTPWIAYKQFCEHFLGPLLLVNYGNPDAIKKLMIYLDGIPIDLVSRLLPKQTYLSPSVFAHIHLHAREQKRLADSKKPVKTNLRLNKSSLMGILDNLESIVSKLSLPKSTTEWGDYYTFTNYSAKAFKKKQEIIKRYLAIAKPRKVWDLGANDGTFSRLASNKGIYTISADNDSLSVEYNYKRLKESGEENILPLILDLNNPTPSLGWENLERKSFIERGPTDLAMALALVHHLAISNNLPFDKIASFFQRICNYLIIEFVPKEDSQVKKLLMNREDIFPSYSQNKFEGEFSKKFKILRRDPIDGSLRVCYLMRNNEKRSGS